MISIENLKNALEQIDKLSDLENLKIFWLGKKGVFADEFAKMKEVSGEEKIALGKKLNEDKQLAQQLISEKEELLKQAYLLQVEKEEYADLTAPCYPLNIAALHPSTIIIEMMKNILLPLGFLVAEGPEVEEDHYNFELMNFPKDHPTRDMQDTFYISPQRLLRTHTSPVQARVMQQEKGKDIKIICPGKAYRRDEDDATHSHQFTQIEGLVVGKNITMADLKGTLNYFLRELFGQKREIRLRASYFPFTEPSVEVDISCLCNKAGCALCKGSSYIEILGAGMVHPNVLKMSGYDPDIYQGFAFGVGVERVAMLKYGIKDIRDFFNNDLRLLKSFCKEIN